MFAGKKKGNLAALTSEQALADTPEASSGTVSDNNISLQGNNVNRNLSDSQGDYAQRSQKKQAEKESKQQGNDKYMLAPTLSSDLDKVLDGTFESRKGEVHLGTTSDFLVNVIGAEQLTQTMPANKAYAAMVSEEVAKKAKRYDSNLHYHELGKTGLYNALDAAEDPIAAFVATDDPETGEDRSDRIVLVTDKTDSANYNVAVIIEVSTGGLLNKKNIKVNKTITVYGKKLLRNVVHTAIKENRILYLKNKSQWAGTESVQFANSRYPISFNNNIEHFWDNVNWNRKTDAEMYYATKKATSLLSDGVQFPKQLTEAMTPDGYCALYF